MATTTRGNEKRGSINNATRQDQTTGPDEARVLSFLVILPLFCEGLALPCDCLCTRLCLCLCFCLFLLPCSPSPNPSLYNPNKRGIHKFFHFSTSTFSKIIVTTKIGTFLKCVVKNRYTCHTNTVLHVVGTI